jgi:hypothetical protein
VRRERADRVWTKGDPVKMRLAASVVLTGLVVVGVSGCAFITPQETTRINQVSDGVDATVGPIGIRDAMLISDDGTTASLVTSLINTGSSRTTVQLQYTADSGPTTAQVVVPANGLVSVRPGGQADVQLSGIKAPPGSLFTISFSAGSSTPTDVRVPVLENDLPGYETLTPTPSPSPSPSVTPSPGQSATPATGSTSSPAPFGSEAPTPSPTP